MNESLQKAINQAADALKVDPVTCMHRLCVMGVDVTKCVWLWLHCKTETPPAFVDFLAKIAEDPARTDLPTLEWVKICTAICADLQARIYGDMGQANEWHIPPQEMELRASMFGVSKHAAMTPEKAVSDFFEWLARRSSYPDKWIKRKDIVKGLQAKYRAADIEPMLMQLCDEKKLMYKTMDEARGRPATAFAAVLR